MDAKEVGDCDAIHQMMDGKHFYLFGMKQPDYTMIPMSTYRALSRGNQTLSSLQCGGQNVPKEFKYIEVVHNHYQY